MNSHIGKVGLGVVVALIMVCNACLVTPESKGNKLPVISSLEADHMSVYPRGASEIKCVASGPEGEAVQLTWSSDGGNLTGDGPTVTWQAPNDYGDYHVMVVAKDTNGGRSEAILTLSVVPRPHKSCCGR